MRASHVLWFGTVVLGVQGLALPAWAAPGDRLFVAGVDTCNTLLDPYAGVDMSVSLPADGPRELWVDVAPFTHLTQYLDAIGGDPNRTGHPATVHTTVAPSGDDVAARFSDPLDGRSSTPLVVHAQPNGAIHASFDDPPEPARPSPLEVSKGSSGAVRALFWNGPDGQDPTPLAVSTRAYGDVRATFWDDPPDWSMPTPLAVHTAADGTLHAAFDDPPEPAMPTPLAVDTALDGTLHAAFDDPPEPAMPTPLQVSTGLTGDIDAAFGVSTTEPRVPIEVKVSAAEGTVTAYLDDPPEPARTLIVVDAEAVGSLAFVDSNGKRLVLTYAQTSGQ
jgi:hypothetical protein